jgi:TPR repeat protein
MKMRVAIFAVAIMVAMAGAAAAEPAAKIYRPLAERGDVRAQNNLGILYDHGQGVPQDFAEALKWYRLAAEKGYALAKATSLTCTAMAVACLRTTLKR